jgi:multidrug transporter EmrE-like cation transporter
MIRYIILSFAILSNVGAQLSLRFGMRNFKINRNPRILDILINVSKNWYVWQGLFLYGAGFALYLYILSKFEVSFIYPILTAVIFILLLVLSSFFLNEPITLKKAVSMSVIILGIFIASF